MTDFAIVLTAEQWNQILTILAEQPFRVSAPIIGAIQSQAAQAQAAQVPVGKMNGTHAVGEPSAP